VWAGHAADPEALTAVVDEYEAWCNETLEHLRAMEANAEDNDEWVYPAVVARWGVRQWEAELDNIKALREDLAAVHDGKPPWRKPRSRPRRDGRPPSSG